MCHVIPPPKKKRLVRCRRRPFDADRLFPGYVVVSEGGKVLAVAVMDWANWRGMAWCGVTWCCGGPACRVAGTRWVHCTYLAGGRWCDGSPWEGHFMLVWVRPPGLSPRAVVGVRHCISEKPMTSCLGDSLNVLSIARCS